MNHEVHFYDTKGFLFAKYNAGSNQKEAEDYVKCASKTLTQALLSIQVIQDYRLDPSNPTIYIDKS